MESINYPLNNKEVSSPSTHSCHEQLPGQSIAEKSEIAIHKITIESHRETGEVVLVFQMRKWISIFDYISWTVRYINSQFLALWKDLRESYDWRKPPLLLPTSVRQKDESSRKRDLEDFLQSILSNKKLRQSAKFQMFFGPKGTLHDIKDPASKSD